jgi:hypothetical protein
MIDTQHDWSSALGSGAVWHSALFPRRVLCAFAPLRETLRSCAPHPVRNVSREGAKGQVDRLESSALLCDLLRIQVERVWADVLLMGPDDSAIQGLGLLEVAFVVQFFENAKVQQV